jgi:RNA polymerase sigma factor (sigma-70 family)
MKEHSETADSVLVRQALAGDQEAFEALVSRYQHALFGLIYHYVGEYHEAQDSMQQVWLQLDLSLAALHQHVHIKPWLFTVARNRSFDTLRRKRLPTFSELVTGNEEDEEAFLDAIPDTSPPPEALVEHRDLQQEILHAIQALPPTYRSVVWLYYGEQLNFSPDWTSPHHAKINCQDPIPPIRTVASRCLDCTVILPRFHTSRGW